MIFFQSSATLKLPLRTLAPLCALTAALALSLSACQLQRPSVEGMSQGVGFNHAPFLQSCTECHEAQRPAPTGSQAHGGGQDCVQCHTPQAGWGPLTSFNHSSAPIPTSCTSCHENRRPEVATYPHSGSNPQNGHYSNNDCVECHRTPPNRTSWSFGHTNALGQTVGFCLPCHYDQGAAKHGSGSSYLSGQGRCQQCHFPGGGWGD